MKKITISLLFSLTINVVFCQGIDTTSINNTTNIVNKKGVRLLPKAGDFAIGLDLVPILNYFGNSFNGTQNNSFNTGFLSNSNTLKAKYFLTDKSAIRVNFKFEVHNTNNSQYVNDDAANDPLANEQVEDKQSSKIRNLGLSAGYEMRRIRGRLNAFYGADIVFVYDKNKDIYTYGNNRTMINPMPTTYNFGDNIIGQNRVLSSVNSGGFGFGSNIFLGLEYFIMPNICLGSELNWGLMYYANVQQYKIEEYWTGYAAEEISNAISPSSGNFTVGMNNPAITLYLMFHF
jgi:hypothetical protein